MPLSNVFIIGTHRSGSTSLYRYLNTHEDIQGGIKKEIHYFTSGIYSGAYTYDSADYLTNFPKTDKILLDASPGYLYGGKELALVLKTHFPESKVLLILRNPVDRFFSFLQHHNSRVSPEKRLEPASFINTSRSEYLSGKLVDSAENRGLREGVYADYLPSWLETFGADLKVILFEDLKDSTETVVSDCFDFMGCDQRKTMQKDTKIHNENRESVYFPLHKLAMKVNLYGEPFFRQYPIVKTSIKKVYGFVNEKTSGNYISNEFREEVEAFYKPHNLRLQEVLEKSDLSTPDWIL